MNKFQIPRRTILAAAPMLVAAPYVVRAQGSKPEKTKVVLAVGGKSALYDLAADPVEEIKVGFDILKSLGIRSNGINFIACPSCSRQEFDVIRVMNALEARLEDIRTPMDVSVIGCKVNGPGEAKEADIGVVGAAPRSLVYRNGEKSHLIDTSRLVDEIEAMVRARVAEKETEKAAEEARLIVRAASE